MYLKVENNIDNNVFTTVITIDSYGTEQMSSDEERELLENFPSKLVYRELTFEKNIKIQGSVPIITEDEADDTDIVTVTLPALTNKEIAIDEEFKAEYKIDLGKIPKSNVNAVLTTVELIAQAYCLIYKEVICEAVQKTLDILREKAPSFEGEEIVTV